MRANALLLWLSARREGSWRQFRAGVDELHADDEDDLVADRGGEFAIHQQLRQSLDCLGHVEFFARECEEGWRVAPPTLAVRQTGSQFSGILCGARTTELLARLQSHADGCQIELAALPTAPDRVRVLAVSCEVVDRLASVAGVRVQHDAPFAILMRIPQITPRSRKSTSEFPVGTDWTIHEFDARNLRWQDVTRMKAQNARSGLFRFRNRFQALHYFSRRDGATQKVPRGVGIFQALAGARRRILTYARERMELRLPAICRPPRLLERALALCSGAPPNNDGPNAQLVYRDVPANIAALAAELLRQPLR